MKVSKYFFWVIFMLQSIGVKTQDLSFYCDVMIRADEASHRLYSHSIFDSLFTKSLYEQESFSNKYEDLKWISIVYPADSSFRTLTWQIDHGDNAYSYHGFIQTKDGMIIKTDSQWGSDNAEDLSGAIKWNKWSGALVYSIFKTGNDNYIMTFQNKDEFTKIKTCEPLVIADDNVILGSPVFQSSEGSSEWINRLVLKYSSDTNAALRYEEKSKKIIYDNLMTVMGRLPGQGVTQVPDGSYKAYEYTEGRWKAIDKLFTESMEVPPRRGRKTNQDLFGRSKG